MVVQTLFRRGEGLAVELPEADLAKLGLTEGSAVEVRYDEQAGRLVVSPANAVAPGISAEFADQVASFIEEYRPALEALAKR